MALTVVQVREIRRLDEQGLERPAIADRLGIGRRYVSEVLSGRDPGRPLNPREAAEQLEAEGWTAACMDPDEWELWRSRNPRMTDTDVAVRPCLDCPIAFAADMRLEGRCNGEPGRQLPPRFEVPDPVDAPPIAVPKEAAQSEPEPPPTPRREPLPMVESTPAPRLAPGERTRELVDRARAIQEQRMADIEAATTPAIDVPCERCAKADVCSIRPTLTVHDVIEFTTLRSGVRVARVVIDCDYFLEDERSARKDDKAIRAIGGSDEGRQRAGRIAAARQTRHSDDEIEAAVAAADGNLTSAARALGYSQTAVSIRMRKIRARNEGDNGVPQRRSA